MIKKFATPFRIAGIQKYRFVSSSSSYTEKTPITISLWEKRKQHKEQVDKRRSKLGIGVNPDVSEFITAPKKPSESRVDVRYDFGGTPELRDLYIDSFGHVLMGKLLEDLDALAGNVAFFHCDNGDSGTHNISLVTAGVEQIKFERQGVPLDNDIIVTGQVVYKGTSSLDVLIEAHVAASNDNNDAYKVKLLDPSEVSSKLLSSVFTYVARNKLTGKAGKVVDLDMSDATPVEQEFFHQREQEAIRRKKVRRGENVGTTMKMLNQELRWAMLERGKSMLDMPAIHNHNNFVLQQTTALENCFICEPQKSNTAGRVFGGFLINKAYMLAQANAYLFSGRQGVLTLVDKITFRRPVEISDLIRLRSRVVYASNETPHRRMVVQVTCDVVHPEKGESYQSNKFMFVFTSTSPSICHTTTGDATSKLADVRSDGGADIDASSATNSYTRTTHSKCVNNSAMPRNPGNDDDNDNTYAHVLPVQSIVNKLVVPLNRLEAEYLYHGACNILGLDPSVVEAQYASKIKNND